MRYGALSSIVLVALIAIGGTTPAAAQPATSPRELFTFGHAPASAATRPQPATADWSRVLDVQPGTRISVDVVASRGLDRHLVLPDAGGVVVLNLTDPSLPEAAVDRLIDLATLQPDTLAALRTGGRLTHALLRLGPDGVFYEGRRIGDLDRVIERIPRSDVVELRRPDRGRRGKVMLGLVAGFGGGYLAGLFAGGGYCLHGSFCGPLVLMSSAGAGTGAIIGGMLGRPEVIYRAPPALHQTPGLGRVGPGSP